MADAVTPRLVPVELDAVREAAPRPVVIRDVIAGELAGRSHEAAMALVRDVLRAAAEQAGERLAVTIVRVPGRRGRLALVRWVEGGDRGVGKTHLACGVLREVLARHGVQGQFWPVVDLLDRLRRTADPDRATESLDDVQEQMQRVPLLVLDDLGAHRGTEWAEERLFGLIEARYRDSLPMVVTTNLTLQELAPRGAA